MWRASQERGASPFSSLLHDFFTDLNGPQLVLSAQFQLRTSFWCRPRACRTVFCRRGVSPSAPCGVVSCAYVCFKRRACARRKRRCVRLVRHGHSVCFGIPAQRHLILYFGQMRLQIFWLGLRDSGPGSNWIVHVRCKSLHLVHMLHVMRAWVYVCTRPKVAVVNARPRLHDLFSTSGSRFICRFESGP